MTPFVEASLHAQDITMTVLFAFFVALGVVTHPRYESLIKSGNLPSGLSRLYCVSKEISSVSTDLQVLMSLIDPAMKDP